MKRGGASVHLESPARRHERAFLAAVHASRRFYRGLVSPPKTPAQFRAYVARLRGPAHVGHLVCLPNGALAGVINISEIVRGAFRSGYLGYYAFVPHVGQGHMTAALKIVISKAFREYGLHRLEANIQPGNLPSITLVKRLGFRLEGYSPRYLRIRGRWRDHERWALTVDDWRAHRTARPKTRPPSRTKRSRSLGRRG